MGLGQYPEDLQWEALVDVLRGRVKVSNNSKPYCRIFPLTLLYLGTHALLRDR